MYILSKSYLFLRVVNFMYLDESFLFL